MKIIATNKKAYHDYHVDQTIEAGIVLVGDEVKSIRRGNISLSGAFATVHDGELYLINCHIAPYEQAYLKKEEDTRKRRKLLLKRRELMRLIGQVSQKGITIVPLKVYFNDRSYIKVEIGICTHKKAAGKKEALKERDIARQTRRELAGRYKF